MAAPHLDVELQHNERLPLLSNRSDGHNMSYMQKAIGQTYQSTGHLAKLLPSGTVLSFQILVPTPAKQGHCSDMNRMMTGGLVVLCALMRFLDFVHAIVSAMIFVAIALFDQNVVSCFYPIPSEDTKQLLTALPVAIGVIGSMLFVSFPTTRHSIGSTLSSQ
ncbi:hypothetical protein BS78_03G226100 [Paspalum vaginatum]|nr:hypothetical protein BS78_03G226100 [Paspalum vaginatum]